ncbi:Endonuclease/exonuclease/phosphatase [Mrakia frigida]|uniref:Endonuclease/exonuclease/phosphatase n=1 Tax=Mrakia frigida TaxID=29902 RepID=UPI003FCBF36B
MLPPSTSASLGFATAVLVASVSGVSLEGSRIVGSSLWLFRPDREVIKLLVESAFLVRDGEKERERVIVGIVANVDSGEEEAAIFILLPTSPSTLQILHLLPILPSTAISIAQRSSVPIQPGQTFNEFKANSISNTTGSNELGGGGVEFVVTFKEGGGSKGKGVEIGVKDVRDVEDLLKEVKRLKGIREQVGNGRVGESHSWLAYYSRTIDPDRRGYKTDHDLPTDRNTHTQTGSHLLLARLRDQHIRKALLARHEEWTTPVPIRLRIATFNVNDSLPPSTLSLAPLVLGPPPSLPADILVFGFEEVDLSVASLVFAPAPVSGEGQAAMTREEVWTERLMEGLGEWRGEFEKFVGVLMIVLVKKDLKPFVGDVSSDSVPVGLMGLMGNKAGVAVRMRVHGSHLTTVTAHLAAFADQLEKRRLDYEEITKRLRFPYVPSEAAKSVTHYGNHEIPECQDPFINISSEQAGTVFWSGDLNYRVDLPDEEGWSLVMKKDVKALLLKDQLNRERAIGRVFAGFEEGDISFPPTFKFEHDTHNYDPKRVLLRLPAWCDRVLFRPSKADLIELQSYVSHPEISFSDHQPVSANFVVSARMIDHQRWKHVQEQVGREADKLENEAIPALEVSERGIDFGVQPAHFDFLPSDPNLSPSAPLSRPWMWVHPSSGVVVPGEKETVHFSVQVDDTSAGMLNTGEEKLEDVLILRVGGGNDSFISVEGDYEPTCFGNSLEMLVRLPGPIRTIPRSSFFEELSPSENAISLPREIWRLVDWLMNNAAGLTGIFLEKGDPIIVAHIQECLDTGAPFDHPHLLSSISSLEPRTNVSTPPPSRHSSQEQRLGSFSVAETLLRLLNSLPEPVVPFGRSQEMCARTQSKDEAFQILDTLPNVSANVLVYLSSFLRFHIEKIPNAKGLTHRLAATFAHVLLREKAGEKAVDLYSRTRWVEYLLEG